MPEISQDERTSCLLASKADRTVGKRVPETEECYKLITNKPKVRYHGVHDVPSSMSEFRKSMTLAVGTAVNWSKKVSTFDRGSLVRYVMIIDYVFMMF